MGHVYVMGPFKPGAQGDCPACYYYRAGPVLRKRERVAIGLQSQCKKASHSKEDETQEKTVGRTFYITFSFPT